MPDRSQIEELKAVANQRVGDVLSALGVREPARGRNGTIALCDPMTGEKNPSLVIWLNRPGGLSWKNFSTDIGGDIINLVAYLKGWWESDDHGRRGEAIKWLKDTCGLRRMSDQERRHQARQARIDDGKRRHDAAAELARSEKWARAVFFNAMPALTGTAGETYLRERRGIELSDLPKGPRGGDRTPQFLRFLPKHNHADPQTKTVSEWPCLVAACTTPAGEVQAVHRTWLTRDGRDKAPVTPPRKCFPDCAGLIIPVWKGDSALTVNAAIGIGLREELGLTEGWEDGLSWAVAAPARRVWAAISLSNLGNIVLPDNIDAVIVHRQNDWQKRGAVEAYARAVEALERQGRPVAEIVAFAGKDLSDTLRGAA